MKILIPNFHFFHFRNIAGCLQTIAEKTDVQTFLWEPDQRPIIDVFDELHPDVVFIHENQLDAAFNIVSKEFDFKYVLVGSKEPEGVEKYPDVIVTTSSFKENFSSPSQTISLLPAAKVTQIHSGKKDDSLESEVLITTGVVPNTGPVINSIQALCHKFNTKIIGDEPIPLPNYLGKTSMFERADFIKSSKVLVDFGSYDYLDAAYLGVPSLFGQNILEGLGSVKTFRDIPTLLQQTQDILDNPEQAQEYAKLMREHITESHTYYHRTASLFSKMGIKDVADSLIDFFKELLK